MSYTGHIHNGVVVFDEPVSLPDGTAVEVAVCTTPKQKTHFERYKDIIGAATGDFAENHDNYIHGTPDASLAAAGLDEEGNVLVHRGASDQPANALASDRDGRMQHLLQGLP